MNPTEKSRALLRRRIFGAIGLSTALVPLALSEACGGIAVVDGSGAGGGGGAGGTATSSATQTGTTSVSVSSVSNSSAVSSGTSMNDCAAYFTGETFPPPEVCDYDPEFWLEGYYCFDMPPGGCSSFEDQCILDQWACGFAQTAEKIACTPAPGDAACCYLLLGDCPIGRPLTIDGVARLASVERGTGWSHALAPQTSHLSDASREALADIWVREGLAEHASVASFSRFVMQLLAVGAPASLIEAAQRACIDETDHAKICFGLASAYANTPLRPGMLNVAGALESVTDRDAIVLSAAAEGCIAETVSAMIIASARDACTDPVVKQALTKIADEETAHAELAWRFLRWSIEQPGDQRPLQGQLKRLFAEAANHVGCGVVTDKQADSDVLRAHGYLSLLERRSIAAHTLAAVVMPAAAALLERSGTHERRDPVVPELTVV